MLVQRLLVAVCFVLNAGQLLADDFAPVMTIERRQVLSARPRESVNVDEAMRACMRDCMLPGASVVIVKDGKTVLKRGYGMANVQTGAPVDPDRTLFRLGSISKALTLLTLTRQIDQGKLDIDADVGKYFEGIQNDEQFDEPVRVRHLLTHTGGFDQIGGSDRQVYEFDQTLEARKAMRPGISEYLRANHLRRVSPAGALFRYDTYGTTLAGAILEGITDSTYSAAMYQEMFSVLGMNKTFVEVDDEHRSDLAVGYGFVNRTFIPQPYEVFATTPASSIDATPADVGRLMEALTGGGANSHGRLLSSEMTKRVLSPQYRAHPEFVGITHGMFESFSSRSADFSKHVRTVGHGGSMRGYITSMTIVPDHGLGIFIATNRAPEAGGGEVNLDTVVNAAIASLGELPNRPRLIVPERNPSVDLTEYEGSYYYGVYCHSPTEADDSNGCWRRGQPRQVAAKRGALTVAENEYLPRGDDVFVRTDGEQMLFFGRDDSQAIKSFVFSSSPDTFERDGI